MLEMMSEKTKEKRKSLDCLAIRNGELSWKKYLGQLEKYFNTAEPKIHAFIEEPGRFKRLKSEAAELEARFPESEGRPPLYGLVVGVKDIYHVNGFETQAGSALPPEELAGEESVAVAATKAAGALILGKTVTTEFAYFAPGPTRNPHNPDHTPGGSSSGSAAAVAAGLAPMAFGTQTIGSISRPASFCGVIGYKPSYERISKTGVIPLAPSLDHAGVFAEDLRMVRAVGKELAEEWIQPADCLARPRIGIVDGLYLQRAQPEMLQHFLALVSRLAKSGYEIEHLDAMPNIDEIAEAHIIILATEAAQVHKNLYEIHGRAYHEKTQDLIERGKRVPKADFLKALDSPKRLRDRLSDLMRTHNIDVWISPSATGPAPRGLSSTGDPIMNLPWTHSGLPTISLPAGKSKNGLPLGLQIASGWYEDERLVLWARQIQKDLGYA